MTSVVVIRYRKSLSIKTHNSPLDDDAKTPSRASNFIWKDVFRSIDQIAE